MQRVQANVDRLKLEYIEEKRLAREAEYEALQDVSRERYTTLAEPGRVGKVQGEIEAVEETVREGEEGLTVGEVEKRRIEVKRRQFGESTVAGTPPLLPTERVHTRART